MLSFEKPKSSTNTSHNSWQYRERTAWTLMKCYVYWYGTHVQLDPIRRSALLLQCASLFMLKAQQHRDVPSSSASWPMRQSWSQAVASPIRLLLVGRSVVGRWSVGGPSVVGRLIVGWQSVDSWLVVGR